MHRLACLKLSIQTSQNLAGPRCPDVELPLTIKIKVSREREGRMSQPIKIHSNVQMYKAGVSLEEAPGGMDIYMRG